MVTWERVWVCVCVHKPTSDHVCSRMLTYAGVCWRVVTYCVAGVDVATSEDNNGVTGEWRGRYSLTHFTCFH
jgi:hypothetical protein